MFHNAYNFKRGVSIDARTRNKSSSVTEGGRPGSSASERVLLTSRLVSSTDTGYVTPWRPWTGPGGEVRYLVRVVCARRQRRDYNKSHAPFSKYKTRAPIPCEGWFAREKTGKDRDTVSPFVPPSRPRVSVGVTCHNGLRFHTFFHRLLIRKVRCFLFYRCAEWTDNPFRFGKLLANETRETRILCKNYSILAVQNTFFICFYYLVV